MVCENCHCNVNKVVAVSTTNKILRVCASCRRAFIREQHYVEDNKKY